MTASSSSLWKSLAPKVNRFHFFFFSFFFFSLSGHVQSPPLPPFPPLQPLLLLSLGGQRVTSCWIITPHLNGRRVEGGSALLPVGWRGLTMEHREEYNKKKMKPSRMKNEVTLWTDVTSITHISCNTRRRYISADYHIYFTLPAPPMVTHTANNGESIGSKGVWGLPRGVSQKSNAKKNYTTWNEKDHKEATDQLDLLTRGWPPLIGEGVRSLRCGLLVVVVAIDRPRRGSQ